MKAIEKESTDQNAIYYADGSITCHGDNVSIANTYIQSRYGRKIVSATMGIKHGCHYLNIEFYCKYKENEYATIYLTEGFIKWDNNRMTNVSKVKQ